MSRRAIVWRGWLALAAGMVLALTTRAATTLPAGFVEETIGGVWNEAVGLVFSGDGRMMVWERAGKVWTVENGVKSATPFLDISEEVAVWNNYGLLGFCLHPDFTNNGYLYLMYTADRHHLRFFGTSSYDPRVTETHVATIGRITRYTARASDGFHTVDLTTRKVLLGEAMTNGFPLVSGQHGVGSLLFGSDGTLLASCGDGASSSITDTGNGSGTYYQQALADGIIRPKENVGAYRCQLVDGLNGKILRLDATTGDGVPGNPFYDASQPRAARSRVWALGLKTPCRVTLRPGTGSHHPADADPGALYIGEVGWNDWDALSICNRPGMNFGWPAYEGMDIQPSYYNSNVANQDAPNPLFGIGGCTKPYFYFRDLIQQDTPGVPLWPNPCNIAQQIPSTLRRFVHARPAIDWKHLTGPARTPGYSGTNATAITVGAAGSPVQGSSFGGACSIGGVWYTGGDFPAAYRNTYFHADYVGEWIKNFVFDTNDAPVAVREFATGAGGVVFLTTHPVDGALYYITWTSTLKKVRYVGTGNQPPTAVASVDRPFGPGPLSVQFTGTNSIDPERLPLGYLWNFGDGSPPSTNANPVHVFNAPAGMPMRFDVTLTVTDRGGASQATGLIVSVNNTPPTVTITSPRDGALYSTAGDSVFACTAQVDDIEHDSSQLTCAWQTVLHHNTHVHTEPVDNNCSTTTILSPEGCDGQTYYYSVILTVTDAAGLATTREVRLYPDCNPAPTPLPAPGGLSLNPSLPPGRNFDLSHWYLGTPDPGQSLSISAADLMAGYTNQWFFTGPDGAMVFWAPVTGGTTANSTYPRSELREQINPPDNSVNWSAAGAHILDAQCKVTRLPSTGKVIIGQIHGVLGAARPLLKFVFTSDTIDAQVKQKPSADTDVHVLFPNVPFNSLITYRIVLQDGVLTMTINGVTQSVDIFANDPAWADQTFYFKAGSYCQDNSGPATEGAQVEFYQLSAAHGTATTVPPSITKSPVDTAVPVGSNVVLSVSAMGGLPMGYQWLKDGAPLGAPDNSILPLYNVQSAQAGLYRAVVSNAWGMATSAVAVLTVLTNFEPIPLAEALDTSNLVWSTTGSPAWEGHYATTHDGLDAARSGIIADGATSSLQTTVNGPGVLSFWWKISSETNADFLTLFFNTAQQARFSGGVDWELRTFNVPLGSQVVKWAYTKNTAAFAGQDRAWIDQVTFTPQPLSITSQPTNWTVNSGSTVTFAVGAAGVPPFDFQWRRDGIPLIESAIVRGSTNATLTLSNVQPGQAGNYSVRVGSVTGSLLSSNALLTVIPVYLLPDALDAPGTVWITNGSPSWNGQSGVTHDGVDAAQSGAIADGKSGYFQTTIQGPRTVSFWWKVSSETNKDLLLFSVGGTEQARISGEMDWQLRSINIGSGSQALRWAYTKNGSTAKGLDRAWVDQVRFLPDTPPAAPDGLVATPISATRIDLRWNDNATNETAYFVERSSNGVAFSRIATSGSNVTIYANTGILAGATCYYRVGASNVAGFSAYSETATATTPEFAAMRINFQPASAPVPAGYFMDSGLVFGDRGNGLVYGWNKDGTSNTKDRNSTRAPDQRFDTYIFSQKSSGTIWDLAVPNGFYDVVIVAGDPDDFASDYRFTVEGVPAMNAKPTTTNRWITGRLSVPVRDGRLTISNATGSVNNRLCFLDVARRVSTFTCPADKNETFGSAWTFDTPPAPPDFCNGGSNQNARIAGTVTNTAGLCGRSFRAIRTWLAIDACGNSNTCSQTVTVNDLTPPTLTCAPARTVEGGTAWTFDSPTALDAGGGMNVAVTVVSTTTNSLCGTALFATRTWLAVDACGNINGCSQTVTVHDTTPPSMACAPSRVVELGTTFHFAAPTATDVADGTNVTIAIVSTTTNLLCGSSFAVTRTWSATDACGNSNRCSQTISVVDSVPPVLTCPPSLTVNAGSVWSFDLPAASDAADGTNVTVAIVWTTTNRLCGAAFAATRTWSATDACGNSNRCAQTVTVLDGRPPELTCAAARTVESGAAWEFDVPVVWDATDGANLSLVVLGRATNRVCGNTVAITQTWSARNSCGISNTCSQTVTVLDTTPPALVCSGATTVEWGAAWTFADPVAGDGVIVTVVSTMTNVLCGKTFSVTRTWNAIDVCGNSNACSQAVTVVDTTPPTIHCAPSRIVEWGTPFRFDDPIASDLADGTNVILQIASTSTNALCGSTFAVTRTWSATDVCGNSNTCSQTLTVADTTPPSILCGDIVTCDPLVVVSPAADDAGDAHPQLVCARDDGRVLSEPFRIGATVVTCAASDACGNSNTCSFSVTVLASLAASGPADQTVYPGSDVVLTTVATGAGPLTYVWRFNGDVIDGATGESLRIPNLPLTAAGKYCVEISGGCASITNCATLDVIDQRIGFCVANQAMYGDTNGQIHGISTLAAMTSLVGSTPLTVGKPGVRAVTIDPLEVPLLVARLPAAGPSAVLPGDVDLVPALALPLNAKDKFDNELLGETFALALNCLLDPALPAFLPGEFLCTRNNDAVRSVRLSASVIQAVASLSDSTVGGLLELANRGLAGMTTGGASLSEIHDALEAVNAAFDGCRLLVTCGATSSLAPANDNFATRLLLEGDSTSGTARSVSATLETGEPQHASGTGGKSVWWQWTPTDSGTVTIRTAGSSFDTVLAVYTGSALDQLVLVFANDDDGVSVWSEVTFEAVAGTSYQIAVDGYLGASGTVILTLSEVITP